MNTYTISLMTHMFLFWLTYETARIFTTKRDISLESAETAGSFVLDETRSCRERVGDLMTHKRTKIGPYIFLQIQDARGSQKPNDAWPKIAAEYEVTQLSARTRE